jgi:hypothetical protein
VKEEAPKRTKKLVLKRSLKRPKIVHENEHHRNESKAKPPARSRREEDVKGHEAKGRNVKQVEGWETRVIHDVLIRRVMRHDETGEVVLVTKHPLDDLSELYVGSVPGSVGDRITREQRRRVSEVVDDILEKEDEWLEVVYDSIEKRCSKEPVGDGVEREREREGQGEEGSREREGGADAGLICNPPYKAASPENSALLSMTHSKRRALPIFNNPAGEREQRKLKILPGLVCSTCAIGVECTEYQEGYVCAFNDAFKAFESRNEEQVLGAMKYIVDKNKERLFRSIHYEEAVNGGALDPTVTRQSESVLSMMRELIELQRESERIELSIMEEKGPVGGGILSRLFGSSSSVPAIPQTIQIPQPIQALPQTSSQIVQTPVMVTRNSAEELVGVDVGVGG